MKSKRKNRLPQESFLSQINDSFDFVETYSIKINKNKVRSNELVFSFFNSIPNWLKWMLKINKKEKIDESLLNYAEGDLIGPFHLFKIFSSEVILGINSKHLDYRLSLLIKKSTINIFVVSTTITINSICGNIRFSIIKTVHSLITKKIIQNMNNYF